MKPINRAYRYGWGLMLAAVLVVACAGPKAFNYGGPETGFILSYRAAKGQALTYQMHNESRMTQEMMGQEMQVNTVQDFGWTLRSLGSSPEGNVRWQITFNQFLTTGKGPQGDFTMDGKELVGKSAELVTSPEGKIIARIGFDKLPKLNVMGQEVDMGAQFRELLVALPAQPVKIGDTWEETRTDTMKQSGVDLLLSSKTRYTVAEQTVCDGQECLKVNSQSTFTVGGQGSQMGANISFEGEGESSGYFLFAYKTGTLLEVVSERLMEGTAAVSGPMDMTIPMSQEIKSTLRLVK
ncbi:MAG: DUF6263 family protein [candidate division KSB1 bacterium]|nr:DUF6263 family protein [candidate division KSB1 bacterium]MDZ7295359.1 DUF6263 family protein [candidate division KSB1 bacterium]MDZ7385108.1 DUF6263 family protein [candidate division KSB1 bacterium]MDZ7393114.1 DUF6263 family protein [candidate division KSB1 bacterium]